jgi:hypothetical protein
MKKYATLVLLCLPMIVFGQSWEKTPFGALGFYETGISVKQTTDGGYILIVSLEDSTSIIDTYNTWLLKTNSFGDTLWTKIIKDCNTRNGGSVIQTLDGGYAIASSSGAWTVNPSIKIVKTNSIGDTLWTNQYFNICCENMSSDIIQTLDSGYVVTGGYYNQKTIKVPEKSFMLKTNFQGDSIWGKIYENTVVSDELLNTVQQTSDGGYILNSEHKLIKTNSLGDTLWTKQYSGTISAVQQTPNGGYVFGGVLLSDTIQKRDYWLVKTNSIGDTLWSKSYDKGVNQHEFLTSLDQTTDDGYILNGFSVALTGNGFVNLSLWLIKTDSIGDTLWTATLDSSFGTEVHQTVDGGYIVIGTKHSIGAHLIKFDLNGYISSIYNLPYNTEEVKLIKIVDILGRETKGDKNMPLFYIYDDGTVEKKMIIE